MKDIREIKKILNNKKISYGKNKNFRRGIYLNKFKNKGSIITEKDVLFSRPQIGLSANEFNKIKKKKIK